MHIHFVCTGNYYRSRLAEAYLKSMELPSITVSSSGNNPDPYYRFNGPICWYAMRLISNNQLVPFMKLFPEKTTSKMLNQADLVIFMTDSHYEYAKKELGFARNTFEIWNIADLDKFPQGDTTRDPEILTFTEQTFRVMQKKIDELTERISQ